uniref:Uncharacterized protein n=1 Tax=Suricata suricatta TaxID=37032 RepID=A0A673TGY3_SURSU
VASVSELISICAAPTLHYDEVMLRRRQWEGRRKNPRSLMMTWALVFLTKPFFCYLFNKS